MTPGAPWHQWTSLSDEFSREEGKFPEGNWRLKIQSMVGFTNWSICSLERYSWAYNQLKNNKYSNHIKLIYLVRNK